MRREWLLRLALVAASIGAVVFCAELAVRLTWTERWYDQLEEAQGRPDLTWFEIGPSSLPLRRDRDTTPKPGGVTRVLFLGDSFTYGLRVPEQETFVALVEERLDSQSDARLQVFNGGIPGSMTEHWRQLFEAMAEQYQPDSVVAVFFLRDGVEGLTTQGLIGHVRDEMQKRAKRSATYRVSSLYRLLTGRLAQRRLSDWYLDAIEKGYVGPKKRTSEWRHAQENLLWLREQTERLGGRFAIVIFPVLFGLDEELYPVQAAVDEIHRFATHSDIPVLSLLPTYRGRHAPDLWVSAHDQHPNSEAHRLAADAIAPFVAEQLAGGAR